MTQGKPRVSLSERVYGAMLRTYPDEFRRDFGGDMRDLFRDHLREARRRAGLRGVIALWLRTIPDLLFTGAHEHEDQMLQATIQDARYALRILRKNPVFTAVAIAVVALGTGAVSTIFSVANAAILRPIPGIARQSEVVDILRTRGDGASSRSASYPYYESLAKNAKTMRGVVAWEMTPVAIGATGGDGTAIEAQSNLVTANYFDVLGTRPVLGRFFNPDEGRVDAPVPVVVMSYDLWRTAFAADSGIVGRKILVNGQQFTVIGVAPPQFNGMYPVLRVSAWIPMPMQPVVRRGGNLLTSPGAGWLQLFGRPVPGVSREAVKTELSGLTKRFAEDVETSENPDQASFASVEVATASGFPIGHTKPVLAFFVVLLAVSGLVLVIASVNVASMLLARAVARRREIAVRIALGAGRARLVRQLLIESVVLFAAGGALGAMLSVYGTRLLAKMPLPVDMPLALDPSPDARVLVVTLAVALVTGVVFGLAPALQGSRHDIATTLRGDTSGSGRTRSRLRNALVAGQVAASLLLLTTSGLFVRALSRGQEVRPGYDVDHIATAAFDVSLSGYDTLRAQTFYADLRMRLQNIPGVTAVSYARMLPLSMSNMGYGIAVPGKTKGNASSSANLVDERYFETLHQPIVAGRGFQPTDNRTAPKVAVVSKAFADRFWSGENPLGKIFYLDSTSAVTIVGVTTDVKFSRLDERRQSFMYLPLAQRYDSRRNVMVRTTGDPAALIATIRETVRSMDPSLPPPVTQTLERSASVALLPQRFAVIVTASLGIAGLVLAAIGLYGVLSFSTAQRTREIGVRMALGAAKGEVLRLVVGEGMRVVGIGVAIGLVLALLGTRLLAPFLFGVSPLDPATFVGMTALLGTTAAVASFLPARRAAGADPMAALRQE